MVHKTDYSCSTNLTVGITNVKEFLHIIRLGRTEVWQECNHKIELEWKIIID